MAFTKPSINFSNIKTDINAAIDEIKNDIKDIFGVENAAFGAAQKTLINFYLGDNKGFSDTIQYFGGKLDFTKYNQIGEPTYYFYLVYPNRKKPETIPIYPNPERVDYNEPTATNIRIGQFGNKTIEKSGCQMKSINIVGNTGLYPYSNASKSKLQEHGIGSGLFFLKLLILMFRFYELKSSFGENYNQYKLIFVDTYKQEAWEVEPNFFNHNVTKEKKFQNLYSIQLTAVKPYMFEPKPESDLSILDQINKDVQEIKNTLDNVVGSITMISDYVINLEKRLLAPLSVISYAISSFKKANRIIKSKASESKSVFWNSEIGFVINKTKDAIKAIRDLITSDIWTKFRDDKISKGEITSEDMPDAPEYTSSGAISIPENIPTNNSGIPPIDFNILQGEIGGVLERIMDADGSLNLIKNDLVDIKNDLNDMMDELQSGINLPDKTQDPDMSGVYPNSPIDLDAMGSLVDFQSNIYNILSNSNYFKSSETINNPAPGIFQDIPEIDYSKAKSKDGRVLNAEYIKTGDTLEKIASRVYGDYSKWEELKRINDLRYPYIASEADILANSWDKVLKYGEYIYYLSNNDTTSSPFEINKENDVTLAMNAFDRAMGIDINVDVNGDFSFTAFGNFVRAYGKENVKQTLIKMFTLEYGSLRANRRIGIRDYSGLPERVIRVIAPIEIDAMVREDVRFNGTQNTIVRREGNILVIYTQVVVNNFNLPIPVTVRRSI